MANKPIYNITEIDGFYKYYDKNRSDKVLPRFSNDILTGLLEKPINLPGVKVFNGYYYAHSLMKLKKTELNKLLTTLKLSSKLKTKYKLEMTIILVIYMSKWIDPESIQEFTKNNVLTTTSITSYLRS